MLRGGKDESGQGSRGQSGRGEHLTFNISVPNRCGYTEAKWTLSSLIAGSRVLTVLDYSIIIILIVSMLHPTNLFTLPKTFIKTYNCVYKQYCTSAMFRTWSRVIYSPVLLYCNIHTVSIEYEPYQALQHFCTTPMYRYTYLHYI